MCNNRDHQPLKKDVSVHLFSPSRKYISINLRQLRMFHYHDYEEFWARSMVYVV